MSSPSSQFIVKPTASFGRLFSRLFIDHRRRHHQGGEIADDWEIIGILDGDISGAGDGFPDGGDEDSDVCEPPDDHVTPPWLNLPSTIKFTILSKADVRRHLEEKISTVCTTLWLSRAEATILLHHFKWSVGRTQEEWLEREEKVRKAVGLLEKPVVDPSYAAKSVCGLCHKKFSGDMLPAASCGHQFCHTCWKGYIKYEISCSPMCLSLRCLNPSCAAAVGRDLMEMLVSDEHKIMFENYLLKSYLTSCKDAKWCPAPGCENAVFSSDAGDIDDPSVTCWCLYRFCWHCTNEAHSPVDCNTVGKWIAEINSQSENWMLANTKPCPKCKIPTESSELITQCAICNYEFCSVCGVDWSDHFSGPDPHVNDTLRPVGFRYSDDIRRSVIEKNLERFNFYYESWAIHESARANAFTELRLFQDVYVKILCDNFGPSENEFDFLVEAHLQIVKCWQLLKWTYAYGYFLNEDEHSKAQLLQFMQQQASDIMMLLHNKVEEIKELLLKQKLPLSCLSDSRRNLLQLTGVTKIHFANMEAALKAGLSEVACVSSHDERKTFSEEGSGHRQDSANSSGSDWMDYLS